MASPSRVQVRRETREGGGVAFITLNDERRLNALGSEIMKQFVDALTSLRDNARLRYVVVTGAGDRAFVAGADVDELADITSPAEARVFINKVHACCDAVRAFPTPVIARINGVALGAGLELAISCDLRVATDTATFGMPEVKLGIPSVVEAAVLPGLIGWGRARQILLLGETFDAREALTMGLVDAVVAPGAFDATVETWLTSLLANGPQAVRLQKALIRRWEGLPLDEAIAAGVDAFAAAFATDEPSTAMARWRADRRKA